MVGGIVKINQRTSQAGFTWIISNQKMKNGKYRVSQTNSSVNLYFTNSTSCNFLTK
jgi:hypothetical protein